jgi:IS5 family transposase
MAPFDFGSSPFCIACLTITNSVAVYSDNKTRGAENENHCRGRVARDLSHRTIVGFHVVVCHQDERQVLPIV